MSVRIQEPRVFRISYLLNDECSCYEGYCLQPQMQHTIHVFVNVSRRVFGADQDGYNEIT